jgi:hypothetical protein
MVFRLGCGLDFSLFRSELGQDGAKARRGYRQDRGSLQPLPSVEKRILVEALCFSRGKLDFSPAEGRSKVRTGFSPGRFPRPALKRMINIKLFPATLKRCFPLLKQRASTKIRFSRPYPDFLLRAASNDHVCGSPQREPHGAHQRHGSRQEIRGSVQEICGFALPNQLLQSTR